MRLFRHSLCCLLLCLTSPLWAEVPAGLYEVRIPVAEQTPATLKTVARDGLSTVLTRLSGQSDWTAYPGVQPFLAQAERFVVQFSYAQAPEPQDPLIETLPFVLTLQFEPAAMSRVVRQSGLPVWPVNRPPVLVWWVLQDSHVDYGSMVRRMTREQDPQWYAAMEAAAQDRGVPLQWPLNDLDDRVNLEADVLWQLDEAAIQEASARYGNAWVVAGRFVQSSDGRWLGNWVLLGEGFPQQLEVQADTEETAVATLMALVAGALSQRYAIVDYGVDEGSLGLLVSGVESFADHMASRRLLESLASVEAVLPERVQDDQVQYRVLLRGDRAALEDELRLRSEVELQESSELDNVLLRWRAK